MKSLLLISSLILPSILMAEARFHSILTSVEPQSCVTLESSEFEAEPEIDYLVQECPGLGGYQVFIRGGDLRYPLHLRYQGQEIELTHLFSFHEVGAKVIEWVYTRGPEGTVRYEALIHRLSFDNHEGHDDSVLVVTKLDGARSCPVALIRSSKTMNMEARGLAEKAADLKCLSPEETSF